MNAAQVLDHFDRICDAPDAIPRLRRFILDLAVRGKLVEQDPNDEPASELLKRIQAERRGWSREARSEARTSRRNLSWSGLQCYCLTVGYGLGSEMYLSRFGPICSQANTRISDRVVPYITDRRLWAERLIIKRYAKERKAVATNGQVFLTSREQRWENCDLRLAGGGD